MKTAVLLGSRETKRTIYVEKAARRIGLPFLFLDWEEWRKNGITLSRPGEMYVKIDPPVWQSCHLSEINCMEGTAERYFCDLLFRSWNLLWGLLSKSAS